MFVIVPFCSVQSLSCVWLFVTPWIAACQGSLSITNSRSLPKFMSIESVMPSNHLILCHPLLLLPSLFPSIRVFSNESALCIRWPKYWSFSFNISPSNEHPGLISFRMDWLDLLAAQGTLKSLLQHHSSKASVLQCSAFFTVQLSCPYMTTGKTIALTRLTFVGKVMSLLFNMLSRLVITFLLKSKHLLISWLQSPSAVILEPPKIKSATVSAVSPSISHEVMGLDAMILVPYLSIFSFFSHFHSVRLQLGRILELETTLIHVFFPFSSFLVMTMPFILFCYPVQYSCLGNPGGQRILVGYCSLGCKDLDMTEWLSLPSYKANYRSYFIYSSQHYAIVIIIMYILDNRGIMRSSH